MTHHPISLARAGLACALLVTALAAGAQDREAPRVTADRDGRTEVVVDDRCVVRFDRRGDRESFSGDCNERRLARAERADDRYRAQRENRDDDTRDRGPQVTLLQDGTARVEVGRDCQAVYDREGRRRSESAGCGDNQLVRADRAMADYRSERATRVTLLQDGQGRVQIGSDCEVAYDGEGRRRSQRGSCSNEQLTLADRAMTDYRSERATRVTLLQDGQGRVQIGSNCEAAYDGEGRRRTQRGSCSNEQLTLADRAMTDYRSERATRVTLLQDGQGRVQIGSNCEAAYDGEGRRRSQRGSCSNEQLTLADRAMTDYRSERATRVSLLQNGQGRVQVGRDCEVSYDREGRRRSHQGSCAAEQLVLADSALAEHRRALPVDTSRRPYGGSKERPGKGSGHVTLQADGEGSVRFSNGCTVSYAADGARRGGTRVCDGAQMLRADQLMATQRQLQQAGSGGS